MSQDEISSIWKIPFLLSVAYWYQYVYNPPNVVKKEEEGKHKRVKDFNSWSGGFIAWGQFAGKCAIWFTSLGEVLVILSLHSLYPSPSDPLPISSYLSPTLATRFLSLLLPSPTATATTPDPTAIRFTPLFWTGWALTMLFGALRLASYAELGKLFTFELSIQEKHKLITSGVYSVVRHPGYTGSIGLRISTLLVAFCPGSWMYESGWLRTLPGISFAVLYVAWDAYVAYGLMWRTRVEDEVLKKEFGKEWEEWSTRVRWRLCPGVY